MRGKEGDFFSSCKPFQLCSGLRTETGSEREKERAKPGKPTRLKERKKEGRRGRKKGKREKRNWDCVALCFILSTEQEKEGCKEKSEREGSVSWDCLLVRRGEDAACKAKLGLELGGLSGSLPSGYSPTTRRSALPACLPACLAGPGSSPPRFFFVVFFYLPPDALFHSSLTSCKILPAFDPL